MRKNNCEVIRKELDEFDETYSPSALKHLEGCAGCREFQQQQMKLRQIVGSLGTVEAPADFDFRLRARLANSASHATFDYWSFARKGFAVAVLLIVFASGVVLVRNIMDQETPVEVVADQNKPAAVPQESPRTIETPAPKPAETVAVADKTPPRNKPERNIQTPRNKRPMATVDFSSLRPEVIGAEPAGNSDAQAVFPIDASLESFRVSLDDGQGNARTISVPTIRFGSQRMLPKGNQLATKGVW